MDKQVKCQNYSRKDLNVMARAAGIKYFCKYKKHELAKMLGIDLPGFQPGNRIFRKARTVEIRDPNGTIITYQSITKAAKALGKPPIQLYVMAVNGKIRII